MTLIRHRNAERMKFSSMLVFIFFWHFLVYCFVAHSEWSPDGFLAIAGTMDFAGGDVVHICSGVSGPPALSAPPVCLQRCLPNTARCGEPSFCSVW
jgi:ammonia channel protein AmtB